MKRLRAVEAGQGEAPKAELNDIGNINKLEQETSKRTSYFNISLVLDGGSSIPQIEFNWLFGCKSYGNGRVISASFC